MTDPSCKLDTCRNTSPRPLVVRCGALGDMVIITALIRRLAERYASPIDILSSGAWTRPLLTGQSGVGNIHILGSRRRPYWLSPDQWRTVAMLRRRPPGPVFMCDETPQTHELLGRGRVAATDLVDGYAGFAAASIPEMHWLQQWREVAERAPSAWPGVVTGPSNQPFLPRIDVLPAQQADFDAWRAQRAFGTAPLVLLQAGNKRTLKRGRLGTLGHHKHWPPERWAAVASAVLADLPGAHVLLCGAPMEFAVLEEIARLCDRGRVHNLANDLPLPRLVALAAAAHSMVAVDSGPAHLAAAVGCPLVVMFGSASPQRWMPRATSAAVVGLGGAPEGLDRVEGIPSERVVAAWRELPGRDPLAS